MIIETVRNFYEFERAFNRCGRSDFTYDGLKALYEYLEQVTEDVYYELDPIALCCDYTEDSLDSALKNYNLKSIEELENKTVVIRVDDNTVIYQVF